MSTDATAPGSVYGDRRPRALDGERSRRIQNDEGGPR